MTLASASLLIFHSTQGCTDLMDKGKGMSKIRILSWNVNGFRAVYKKGFMDWMHREQPEILCLQETKAEEGQIQKELKDVQGYHYTFCSAQRKGYSGVAMFSKEKPISVKLGFGREIFDSEGRTIVAEFPTFVLCNVYFPNGGSGPERLQYKMDFYAKFQEFTTKLRKQGKSVIVCGDVNTAHREIDLARPKENSKVSGFLPMERAWVDSFLASGFKDSFRLFNQKPAQYSWWDMKSGARARNVGWRIDYFLVSDDLQPKLKNAFIMPEVLGSDHCPVGIDLMLES
jgi:exodeoxyribonuclease III